jgi:hypothetical protein
MLLSPYFFDPEDPNDNFQKAMGDYKAWYFWAMVLDHGTAVAHTVVSTAENSTTYFIVDPSVDGHPFIPPEDLICMLTGHEEEGKHWGYSWTIQQMSNNWHLLIQARYEGQPYEVNDYALKINSDIKKVDIIPKSEIWKSIEEINF